MRRLTVRPQQRRIRSDSNGGSEAGARPRPGGSGSMRPATTIVAEAGSWWWRCPAEVAQRKPAEAAIHVDGSGDSR